MIEVHLLLIVEAALVPSLPDVSREGEKLLPICSLFDDVFVRPRLGVSFCKRPLGRADESLQLGRKLAQVIPHRLRYRVVVDVRTDAVIALEPIQKSSRAPT